MAKVEYNALKHMLKTIVASGLGAGHAVTADLEQPADQIPWVSVSLDRRDAPSEQPIRAGTGQRYRLRFSIWCTCWSYDGIEQAGELRDKLLGDVEDILMSNRTITASGSQLSGGQLQGGEFVTANYQRDESNVPTYLAGGEIVYEGDVTATI